MVAAREAARGVAARGMAALAVAVAATGALAAGTMAAASAPGPLPQPPGRRKAPPDPCAAVAE
eukprot:3650977-Prymnesium_polylepis.1